MAATALAGNLDFIVLLGISLSLIPGSIRAPREVTTGSPCVSPSRFQLNTESILLDGPTRHLLLMAFRMGFEDSGSSTRSSYNLAIKSRMILALDPNFLSIYLSRVTRPSST